MSLISHGPISNEFDITSEELGKIIQDLTNENQRIRQNLDISQSFCEQYEAQVSSLKSEIQSLQELIEIKDALLETYREKQS